MNSNNLCFMLPCVGGESVGVISESDSSGGKTTFPWGGDLEGKVVYVVGI